MVKYNEAKIYKVISKDRKMCYIDSTCSSLSNKLYTHRKNYTDGKVTDLNKIFDKYGTGNVSIELIEKFPCKDKEELNKRKNEWIDKTECINSKYIDKINTYKELEIAMGGFSDDELDLFDTDEDDVSNVENNIAKLSMENIINNLDVRAITKQRYLQFLNKFKKLANYKEDDPEYIKKLGIEGIKKILLTHYKPEQTQSMRKYYDMFSNIAKVCKYEEFGNECRKVIYDYNKSYTPISDREIITDWNTIIDKFNKYRKSKGNSLEWMITALYIYNDPRRTTDYANMKFVDDRKDATDDKTNYYVKNEKKFIINYHKTSKKQGMYELDVTDELVDILKDPVFENGITYDGNEISGMVVNVLGVGIREIRRSKISKFYETYQTKDDTIQLARNMGHSIGWQFAYRQNDKLKNKEEIDIDANI